MKLVFLSGKYSADREIYQSVGYTVKERIPVMIDCPLLFAGECSGFPDGKEVDRQKRDQNSGQKRSHDKSAYDEYEDRRDLRQYLQDKYIDKLPDKIARAIDDVLLLSVLYIAMVFEREIVVLVDDAADKSKPVVICSLE